MVEEKDGRKELGKRGEDVALEFLLERGMVLVARNWRSGHREIDLIVEDADFIRIVEVRSLCYPNNVEPAETVDGQKRRWVLSAAKRFIARYMIVKEVAFDIVSVVFNGEIHKIEYIQNAFLPEW